MRKRMNMRPANGVVSALIVCFFLVHGLLGSFAPLLSLPGSLMWVVWIGVGFVGLHVALCAVTSFQQMTDKEFPPSTRKKRHLALKWATGTLLACAVGLHIASMRAPAMLSAAPFAPKLATVVVAAVLAWHVCVGMKSLLKDVGLVKELMVPLRALVCVLAVLFAIMTLV